MRKSWDEHFMNIARECATMGTCYRRQVGCVLVDDRKNILSTGFNGPPHGWSHCRYEEYSRCPGAEAPSGTSLNHCYALHAEQNAILHCQDKMRVHTCYTTVSPCATICIKELLQTACCRIVFLEEYSQPEAKKLWTRSSLLIKGRIGPYAEHRTWEHMINEGINQPWETVVLASSGNR